MAQRNGIPMSGLRKYREVDFGIQELERGRWRWYFYRPVRNRATSGSFAGTTDSPDSALRDCQAAIDAWLTSQGGDLGVHGRASKDV
jgi:hypothetical protein